MFYFLGQVVGSEILFFFIIIHNLHHLSVFHTCLFTCLKNPGLGGSAVRPFVNYKALGKLDFSEM